MSAELPPWPARCEADNLAMFKWLNPKLDKLGIAKIWGEKESFEDEEDQTEIVFQLVKRRATKIRVSLPGAIEGAERGDIELLREVLVELAKEPRVGRFINLPKQKRACAGPASAKFSTEIVLTASAKRNAFDGPQMMSIASVHYGASASERSGADKLMGGRRCTLQRCAGKSPIIRSLTD